MALIASEKINLFQRFKEKEIDKLRELSVTFKANKNVEKAQLVDVLIEIKSQDIKGLKSLQKELSQVGLSMEAEYAGFLLKEKLRTKSAEEKTKKEQIKKAKLERRKKKKATKASNTELLGLSQEVYDSMAKRIELNSQRHRDRIKGKESDK